MFESKLIDFSSIWLGAGAVEFIICHAEVTIAFVEEKKIPEVRKCCTSFLGVGKEFGVGFLKLDSEDD